MVEVDISERQAIGILLWYTTTIFILGLSAGISLVNIFNTIMGLL